MNIYLLSLQTHWTLRRARMTDGSKGLAFNNFLSAIKLNINSSISVKVMMSDLHDFCSVRNVEMSSFWHEHGM